MQTQVEQGKGTADHLMPLGNWFFSTHLTCVEGPCISHQGPWGTPSEPPNNIYPRNQSIFLGFFLR